MKIQSVEAATREKGEEYSVYVHLGYHN